MDRVYDIKSRSRHKPLSLLIESVDQAEELPEPLTDEFYALHSPLLAGAADNYCEGVVQTSFKSYGEYGQCSATFTMPKFRWPWYRLLQFLLLRRLPT